MKDREKSKKRKTSKQKSLSPPSRAGLRAAAPPGDSLLHTLSDHKRPVLAVAVTPDGNCAVSASSDKTLKVWSISSGKLIHTLKGHTNAVSGVAISPDGESAVSASTDNTLKVWNISSGKLINTPIGHTNYVRGVAISPDGKSAVSASEDKTLKVWNISSGTLINTLIGHTHSVYGVAISPDGKSAVSASSDNTLKVWNISSGTLIRTLIGHTNPVSGVAISPDGQCVVSASLDNTLKVWNLHTGKLIRTLEGHTSYVTSVAVSHDNQFVISGAYDNTVRVWNLFTGDSIAVLKGHTDAVWGVAVSRDGRYIVSGSGNINSRSPDNTVRVWDFRAILKRFAPAVRSVQYTNAKVVLVGETGVGKTGLAGRLVTGKYDAPRESTHGMNVRTLHSEGHREVMLWDFAGQDEYRLVHQLFLNQTNVALVLYDPTKSNDTFSGVEYWEKALPKTIGGTHTKILVAARVDVGNPRMTAEFIKDYCRQRDYLDHYVTSAKINRGCDELRKAVLQAIPWDDLPATSSPEIFKNIKDFLEKARGKKRVLAREQDLFIEFCDSLGDGAPTKDEFRTVVGHVETAGLIKRLSFGDLVLLKPELLNGYASDVIDEARRHPMGLGCVNRSKVLRADIEIKHKVDLGEDDRRFLLHAVVELFLNLGLALEQDGELVFPSKFNREMPDLSTDPVVEVEFSFEGPVDNIYTTLVVKLYYGGIFKLKGLYKNAAEFLDGAGKVCGFQLKTKGDGEGELHVFYGKDVSDENKALFLKIIADHFSDRSIIPRRERIYRCPECGELVRDRNAVRSRLEQGKTQMRCNYCDADFLLIDALETLYKDERRFLAQIEQMETRSTALQKTKADLVALSGEMRSPRFHEWAGNVDNAFLGLVFTDIMDSTGMSRRLDLTEHGDLLDTHYNQAKQLIAEENGFLVKTMGDAVFATFRNADSAVRFALDFTKNPGPENIKIRSGVHFGQIGIKKDDVHGDEVAYAHRVCEAAIPEAVWTSQAVYDAVAKSGRQRDLKWTEHPEVKLKGFDDKVYTLWSVRK